MEYNKEEVIKEFKDWSKFRVQGVWKDSIEKLLIEFIEQRLVKKLTLTDVSQQSELLSDYNNFINNECVLAGGILTEFEIKKFQERNCG